MTTPTFKYLQLINDGRTNRPLFLCSVTLCPCLYSLCFNYLFTNFPSSLNCELVWAHLKFLYILPYSLGVSYISQQLSKGLIVKDGRKRETKGRSFKSVISAPCLILQLLTLLSFPLFAVILLSPFLLPAS